MGNPLKIIGVSKIIGGNAGKYKDQQKVWTVKRKFLNRSLIKNDVVLYNYSTESEKKSVESQQGDFIAVIVGVPGDTIPENSTDLSSQAVTGVINNGFYLLERNSSGKFWLVPESNIVDVVFYP